MNKLQLALVAALVGGLLASDASAFFGRSCKRGRDCDKGYTTKRADRKCAPKCEERVVGRFEEEACLEQCINIKVPRKKTRLCENVEKCCTETRCDKNCWKLKPCDVKVVCDDGFEETIHLNGDGE
jgi:hypothetical protein